MVFAGAGAAGIASARFFIELGVDPANVLLTDTKGVIHSERDDLTDIKREFAVQTDARTLADALEGADSLIGVSVAGTVSKEMVQSMAADPIVFALANPDPEIPYPDARAARDDVIMATGRSDYPNQVNNVLGFPFIFRGALDVRARAVSEKMKIAAARALADLAKEPVPDSVLRAYDLERLQFGPEYLIPKPFDPRVLWTVAPAVAKAAMDEGLAGAPIEDFDEYRAQLQTRFRASHSLINAITTKAMEQPKKVVYPHAEDIRLIRAARRVADEGIARPVLLGSLQRIEELADAVRAVLGRDGGDRPHQRDLRAQSLCSRPGGAPQASWSLSEGGLGTNCRSQHVRLPHGPRRQGRCGARRPEHLLPGHHPPRPPGAEGRRGALDRQFRLSGRGPGDRLFFTDCAVNIEPTAEQLAEIALAATTTAQNDFDRDPRVAFISYSDFGSAGGSEPARVRRAVELFRLARPDIPVDGEMQADTAVMPELLKDRRPEGPLAREANVLVFPNLTAANASYKLLNRLGDAEVIGPILSGLSKTVHVLQRDASVNDVVNMTAIAVAEAQRRERAGNRSPA